MWWGCHTLGKFQVRDTQTLIGKNKRKKLQVIWHIHMTTKSSIFKDTFKQISLCSGGLEYVILIITINVFVSSWLIMVIIATFFKTILSIEKAIRFIFCTTYSRKDASHLASTADGAFNLKVST